MLLFVLPFVPASLSAACSPSFRGNRSSRATADDPACVPFNLTRFVVK